MGGGEGVHRCLKVERKQRWRRGLTFLLRLRAFGKRQPNYSSTMVLAVGGSPLRPFTGKANVLGPAWGVR